MNKILEEFIIFAATEDNAMIWWTAFTFIGTLLAITMWRCPVFLCVPFIFLWVLFTPVSKTSKEKQLEEVSCDLYDQFEDL